MAFHFYFRENIKRKSCRYRQYNQCPLLIAIYLLFRIILAYQNWQKFRWHIPTLYHMVWLVHHPHKRLIHKIRIWKNKSVENRCSIDSRCTRVCVCSVVFVRVNSIVFIKHDPIAIDVVIIIDNIIQKWTLSEWIRLDWSLGDEKKKFIERMGMNLACVECRYAINISN